jgi:hypothetical protein
MIDVGGGRTDVGGGTIDVGGGRIDVGSGRTDVGVGSAGNVGVERGGTIPVGVEVGIDPTPEVGDGPGFPLFGVAVGGWSVLMAVRKTGVMGVAVTEPAPVSGHPCRATGNNKQLDGSAQILKLNVVNCVPLQTSTRFPFKTSAVRQVTGAVADVSTSKAAKSGKIRTTCGRSFTQNWHCISTTFSPVIGIIGVSAVDVGRTVATGAAV